LRRIEGIQELRPAARNVPHVAGDENQAVLDGRGRQQSVDDRERIGHAQATPAFRHRGRDRQDARSEHRLEPIQAQFETLRLRGIAAYLADDQDRQVEVRGIDVPIPARDLGVRPLALLKLRP
jgi:hypothetical protein